jgi:FHA domain/von Willebrand factor type A domain
MHPASIMASTAGARQKLVCAAATVALLFASSVDGYEYRVYGDGVQLGCWQMEPSQLVCDFRRFAPSQPEQVTARLAGRELPAPRVTPYAAEPGTSAVMFLVDVSDAELPVAPVAARDHLLSLLDAAPPYQNYGLASFANEVEIHAPLAPGTDRIRNLLGELTPGGEPAELYRSALEAVRLLGQYPAKRRALFLLSDGLANDSAYFHDDVVDAARQYDVTIFGIGYVKSPALSTALERLRRLAEDTGGLYVTAEPGAGLAQNFASRAFARLASGGRLVLDLSTALADSVPPPPDAVLELYWQGAGSSASVQVPLRLPLAAGPPGTSVAATTPRLVPMPASSVARAPPARRQGWFSRDWPWTGIGATLLVAGGLLAWFLGRRHRDGRREPAWAETLELNARSFAYVEIQDELHTRHPVSGEVFRIGRHADNELMVADASISRFHAEIKHELNSRYVIRDLESLNSVYVNGRKARTAILSNGDLIELGDVTLKFTVFAAHDHPDLDGGSDSTVTPFRSSDKKKGLRPV